MEGSATIDSCPNTGTTALIEEVANLKHEEVLEVTHSSLRRIIASDSILADLPGDVTVEEVLSQTAVVYGQSITVTVLRGAESPLSVVIPQTGATVRDLQKAIQRNFDLRQQRLKSKTKISWKYIWKTYHLRHGSQVMKNQQEPVTNYGVRNKSEIEFVKRLGRHDGGHKIDDRFSD